MLITIQKGGKPLTIDSRYVYGEIHTDDGILCLPQDIDPSEEEETERQATIYAEEHNLLVPHDKIKEAAYVNL